LSSINSCIDDGGVQLALPRYLVNGMHVVTELFMQKVMASPGQVRWGFLHL
jgi:hypothetical protein